MASELHPLRFELQIWLSRLPWAPWQTHGASSWEFQTGNFAVSYPIGAPKPDIQMQIFLYFLMPLFLREKNINLLDIYKNAVFANWEKYEVSRNFCLVLL